MKKPFGQNFLFDPGILRKIVDCGDIYASETVVEIGPGLGTLTRFISEHAERVIAIEFDKKLIGRLTENLSGLSNVEIITADALKYPYDKISGRFKVVANIPERKGNPMITRVVCLSLRREVGCVQRPHKMFKIMAFIHLPTVERRATLPLVYIILHTMKEVSQL